MLMFLQYTSSVVASDLLTIAVVPWVATLLPGELKEAAARGDCRLSWMFLLLDTWVLLVVYYCIIGEY